MKKFVASLSEEEKTELRILLQANYNSSISENERMENWIKEMQDISHKYSVLPSSSFTPNI